jgi:hypothetical protein
MKTTTTGLNQTGEKDCETKAETWNSKNIPCKPSVLIGKKLESIWWHIYTSLLGTESLVQLHPTGPWSSIVVFRFREHETRRALVSAQPSLGLLSLCSTPCIESIRNASSFWPMWNTINN